jgi:hypothetical protein
MDNGPVSPFIAEHRRNSVLKTSRTDSPKADELLQKILAVQMHGLGATQDQIARVVGKQKLWVNALLKGVPRRPT